MVLVLPMNLAKTPVEMFPWNLEIEEKTMVLFQNLNLNSGVWIFVKYKYISWC